MLPLLFVLTAISFMFFLHHYFNYWNRLGFSQTNFSFREKFGKIFSMSFPSLHVYNQLKSNGVFGFFISFNPIVMITSPALINNILIRYSQKFYNRKLENDREFDPFSTNLFTLQDDDWKKTRRMLSPAFSLSKLKNAVPAAVKVGNDLTKFVEINETVEVHKLMKRVMTDFITLWVFSINADSINHPSPSNEFYKASMKLFSTWFDVTKFYLASFAPKFWNLLKIKFHAIESENFFRRMVNEISDHRANGTNSKKDFVQFLINEERDNPEFGKLELAALTANIYYASLEATTSALTFGFYELAKNEKVRRECQAEIDKILSPTDELTHENLKQMKYLECCVHETLRKYPVASSVTRKCGEDFAVPATKLTIPKGAAVYISSFRVHRDPEIFKSPMEFRPERFLASSKGCDAPGVPYFPFGSGHHACIGQSLALIVMKTIFCMLLRRFDVELVNDNGREINFVKHQIVLTPSKEILIKFDERKPL